MKKIDLEKSFSILANIGVIAGIVFLGLEIQQNNELLAAQQRFNRLSVQLGTNDLFIQNPDLSDLVVKIRDGQVPLTPAEYQRIGSLEVRVLSAQEWSFRELPEQELPLKLWRTVAARSTWVNIWETRKADLDPRFVQFMEENVLNER